ncbi:hypothetical protein A33M_1974 [Rhodovulum sp. PH10]|nr:hypothetical protein A33M_1974 [Rhodovulum sp. PH10]
MITPAGARGQAFPDAGKPPAGRTVPAPAGRPGGPQKAPERRSGRVPRPPRAAREAPRVARDRPRRRLVPAARDRAAGRAHAISPTDHAFVMSFIMLPDFGRSAVASGGYTVLIGTGSGPRREPVPQPPSPPGS